MSSLRWEYQRDLYKLYRENWNLEHRQDLKEYRREYRRLHPQETRQQWKQDTARYRERINPDILRERQREYDRRHRIKTAAERAARDNQ